MPVKVTALLQIVTTSAPIFLNVPRCKLVKSHLLRMAKTIHVYGYDEFKSTAKDLRDKVVFALFSGTTGDDGKSWCPDCVKADPVVLSCLSDLPSDSVFIHCGVGDRAFWKDQNNSFRKDSDLKLKSVPTLLKLGEPHRLEEEQCANADLVKMMFKDD